MKKYDEHIQKQLAKPMTWFVKYFPARIRNVNEREARARQFVFDFKDGHSCEDAALQVAYYLQSRYGHHCTEMVLACIPAASAANTELRYKRFCQRVNELCGIVSAYEHIHITGDRPTIHDHRKHEEKLRKMATFTLDTTWFIGKQVVVFDDIITRGISYAAFACQLEAAGAKVQEGVFLARTHYKVRLND